MGKSTRIMMVSTDRTLLCLHVEAVWGVRLPSFLENEVELLREGLRPAWKLCAAALADERVHIWRPDVNVAEHAALQEGLVPTYYN